MNFIKIKKLIILVIVLVAFSCINFFTIFAVDWYEGKTCWYEECRGARISIWDVETEKLLKKIDIVDIDYEIAKNYRRFSDLTKPEIIDLNGKLTNEMIFGFIDPISLSTNLYDKSIVLPEMFNRINVTEEDKVSKINEWIHDENNINKLLSALSLTDEEYIAWNNDKLCLLIEPAIIIHTIETTNNLWFLTSADLGMLGINDFAEKDKLFDKGKLTSTAFKALPYGVFKKDNGCIKKIVPYLSEDREAKTDKDGFYEMINSLGCMELLASASSEISGYEKSNLAENETVTETDIVDTINDESNEKIKNDEITADSSVNEIEKDINSNTSIKSDIVIESDNDRNINLENDNLFEKLKLPLLIVADILLIIIILILLFGKKSKNEKSSYTYDKVDLNEKSNSQNKKNEEPYINANLNDTKHIITCTEIECRYNNNGICESSVVVNLGKLCNKDNRYMYFEEKDD